MFWHTIKCRLKSVHCNAKQRQRKLENRKFKGSNPATIGSGKKTVMSVLKNSIKTGGSLGTDKIVIVRITHTKTIWHLLPNRKIQQTPFLSSKNCQNIYC
jgi:hypothetical protein